ncbi:unnamed protein product [Parnassius apollo]|uniref:(apollo) hypothetical protein n=1 Tax=Parnassius apollo TaxID=110799 RepID=A0A8S3XKU3_PARAO|nr:unnamed protein product [Parnassius apollo]
MEPANYKFSYKVSDYESGSDFGHVENRQDDKAEGTYFVVLLDGTKQVVEYEADEDGFKPRISVIPADTASSRAGELEQKQYSNKIELTGISGIDNINHHQVTKILASKLDMDANSVKSIKQIEGRKGKDGYLLLELSDETESEKWIQAAKMKILKINDILPNAPMIYNEGKDRITLSRALTKTNKIILWNAKKQLGSEYKYIWFKNGHIFARKGDKDKITTIRCIEDIQILAKKSLFSP